MCLPLKQLLLISSLFSVAMNFDMPFLSFLLQLNDWNCGCVSFVFQKKMKGQGSYVPPRYVPLDQSDLEAEISPRNDEPPSRSQDPAQWSSGICACCDDMQSCMLLSAL